jgi:putative phage-type endonuclease
MPLDFHTAMRPTIITAHPTRPFNIVQTDQRSPEWFQARLGRVTGSRAAAIWDRTKKGEKTAAWGNYQTQLLAEMLTAVSADDVYVTAEMQRGIELEPAARAALSERLGVQIRETGFLAHRELRIGASLDGDIDDFRAVVELKCPKTTTHLGYLENGVIPPDYEGQCLHNLYVSGAEVLYFGSFDDRVPFHLQTMAVYRKAKDMPLEEYGQRLQEFLGELKTRYEHLMELKTIPVS